MNTYGKRAQQAWQQLAPSAYAQIPDPNRHFSTLGHEAQNQIADLTTQLAGPTTVGVAAPAEGLGRAQPLGRQALATHRRVHYGSPQVWHEPSSSTETDEREVDDRRRDGGTAEYEHWAWAASDR